MAHLDKNVQSSNLNPSAKIFQPRNGAGAKNALSLQQLQKQLACPMHGNGQQQLEMQPAMVFVPTAQGHHAVHGIYYPNRCLQTLQPQQQAPQQATLIQLPQHSQGVQFVPSQLLQQQSQAPEQQQLPQQAQISQVSAQPELAQAQGDQQLLQHAQIVNLPQQFPEQAMSQEQELPQQLQLAQRPQILQLPQQPQNLQLSQHQHIPQHPQIYHVQQPQQSPMMQQPQSNQRSPILMLAQQAQLQPQPYQQLLLPQQPGQDVSYQQLPGVYQQPQVAGAGAGTGAAFGSNHSLDNRSMMGGPQLAQGYRQPWQAELHAKPMKVLPEKPKFNCNQEQQQLPRGQQQQQQQPYAQQQPFSFAAPQQQLPRYQQQPREPQQQFHTQPAFCERPRLNNLGQANAEPIYINEGSLYLSSAKALAQLNKRIVDTLLDIMAHQGGPIPFEDIVVNLSLILNCPLSLVRRLVPNVMYEIFNKGYIRRVNDHFIIGSMPEAVSEEQQHQQQQQE